ncbi:MAG: sigma 54-interacting transcriptional regulator [Gemmataceae bacterium]
MTAPTPYLLVNRDDGISEVIPLEPSERYGMGRAPTNRIVVKDELCSREHAEVYADDGRWSLRDLGSLNGTRLNGELITGDAVLDPGDEVRIGRTKVTYVERVPGLPDSKPEESPTTEESVAIRKRLGDTRFQQPVVEMEPVAPGKEPTRDRIDRDLTRLYQLALRMGEARSIDDVAEVVLSGLLEAIPAEVGAILTVRENRELDILAYRTRDPSAKTYHKVSQFVSSEVLSTKQAVLAEDVATHATFRKRDSLADLKATSLICAPVKVDSQVVGLIHLYSSNNVRGLETEDLEFALAVANQLGPAISNLRKTDRLSIENRELRDQLRVESELVGESWAMQEIERQIARVAITNATVLVRGESGVGKELVARALHYSSPRREGPFVCINCAALTETLLESELFGHEKGAFTGATEKMVGKFEAADKGTIFLDEIGEMSVGTQAKFLRVLEGHPFERVGGHTPIRVDVRVISATNQPLEVNLQNGRFRRDLFFRLKVVEILVPPLRERMGDVPLLADHFFKRFVKETGRKLRGFSPAAMDKMSHYHWPVNVR